MAILATAVWEVRPTNGDNLNGAGYDAGIASAGTDYSLQDAAQLSLTDLATSGAGVTTLTSATGGFTSAMIGNAIRINAGTNFTVGYYFITARTDTNTVTLDRSPTAAGAGSSGEGKVGGATASISGQTTTTLEGSVIAGNTTYIKNETWAENVTTSVSGSGSSRIAWIGYGSTRGDNIRATNDLGGGAGDTWTVSGAITNNLYKNIVFKGAADDGFAIGANSSDNHLFVNCRFTGNGGDGFSSENLRSIQAYFFNCELDNNTSNGYDNQQANNESEGFFFACEIHDNTAEGLKNDGLNLRYCLVYANSGSGILSTVGDSTLIHVTSYGNTGASSDGASLDGGGSLNQIFNCIFASNGAYGIDYDASTTNSIFLDFTDYNNFNGNATAAVNNGATQAHDSTADPQFTNAASDNFAIGTNLKGLGFPGSYPSGLSVGYVDIGAVQREEASGGGGSSISTAKLVIPENAGLAL